MPLAQSGNFNKRKFFLELWAHRPHTKKPAFARNQQGSTGHSYGQNQNYATNGNFSHDSSHQNTNTNTFYDRTKNSVSSQINCDSNMNHNMTNNNMSQMNDTNHRNMHQYNMNHNAIGNDGIIDQSVKLQHESKKNVLFDDIGSQKKTENLSSYQNNNSGNRNIDNTPAWMTNKDTPSKKARMFTLYGTNLNVGSAPNLRAMPLSLDNCLPAAVIRFGTSSENEIPFACHLDSCAAMNTGSLHLHQWIMTKYPHLVEKYEQFDDANPFRPITLDCAVPQSEAEKTTGKLTAVVTYRTRYVDKVGKNLTLSFGLGASIRVNAIIGLPTFREWKIVLNVDSKRASSKLLECYFELCFQHAAKGFPDGVTFDPATFVRPQQQTNTGLSLLAQAAAASSLQISTNNLEKSIVIDMNNCSSNNHA